MIHLNIEAGTNITKTIYEKTIQKEWHFCMHWTRMLSIFEVIFAKKSVDKNLSYNTRVKTLLNMLDENVRACEETITDKETITESTPLLWQGKRKTLKTRCCPCFFRSKKRPVKNSQANRVVSGRENSALA